MKFNLFIGISMFKRVIISMTQMSLSLCTRQHPTLDEIGMVYCYWYSLSSNASSRWPCSIELFFSNTLKKAMWVLRLLTVTYILSVLLRPSQN